jgi:predicted nuclease of predicted toxin-antitoxin system
LKFLIDNQLPPALAKHLQTRGVMASHVEDVGLSAADDKSIWAFAYAHGFVIVSKDQDFVYLTLADPTGPSFVWVRIGNCRTQLLLATFDRLLPSIVGALVAGQKIVELR